MTYLRNTAIKTTPPLRPVSGQRRILVAILVLLGLGCLRPAQANAQANTDVTLDDEVAAREPLACVAPPPPPYEGRSLWEANLWSGGVVPYEFDANVTANNQVAMRSAMNALEAVANLHFVVRAGQSDYLHILNDTGNFTMGIGNYGGRQEVHIFNWNFRYIMCHELMHSLGVRHEQARPDRDTYITVNYSNIQAGWGPQYDIQSGTPMGTFDFDSIMCYSACEASVCCPSGSNCSCSSACWTMTAKPDWAPYQSLMGNNSHLSLQDSAGLASRYGDNPCPAFTQQPAARSAVGAGHTISLTAIATGSPTPTYRWRRNNVNLVDDGHRTGSATSTLTISAATAADAGSYTCVATNSCRSLTSNAALLTVDNIAWSQRVGPSPRINHAIAYDSARGVTVLFGGDTSDGNNSETWEWNGTIWTQRAVVGPSARVYHQMVYDSARHVTVLFGGYANGTTSGETWEWNGTAWTQRVVSGPSARYSHAMTYDASRGVTVLFGGTNATSGETSGDTWEWNGNAWTQRLTSGPSIRAYHAMSYDAARGVTVLFGGYYNGTAYAETWEWNGTVWTQRAGGPSGRTNFAMSYDAARAVTVLFAGINSTGTNAETWEWNGSAWTRRAVGGPTSRAYHAMAYDTARGVTVLFGGNTGSFSRETWEWNGNTWVQLATSPTPRVNHAMTFDSARGVAVLFGGYDGNPNGQTWEWSGTQWSQRVVPGPSPRSYHAMAFDAARGVTVLFGGTTESGANNETWEWNGVTWTQRAVSGPSPRYAHTMAYDSARGVTVLVGGYFFDTTAHYYADVWEWNGTAWTQRAVSGPSPRAYHAMSYDSARGVMVVFGGYDGSVNSDVWEWSGTGAWTQRVVGGPSSRSNLSLVYDVARGVSVLFGGINSTASNNDTWQWNGNGAGTWDQRSPIDGPSVRAYHASAYDANRHVMVVFGGNTNAYSGETWELGPPCVAPTFTAQPAAQIVCASGTAAFSVNAAGSSLAYQWQWQQVGAPGIWTNVLEGVNADSGGVPRFVATGTVTQAVALFRSNTPLATLDVITTLRCVVTSNCGSVTSNAASLTVKSPPSLSQQPDNTAACPASEASFSVAASGTEPLAYQWRKGGVPIDSSTGGQGNPSAATSTLTLLNLQVSDADTYDCVVANSCGSVTSNPATLTICIGDFNCDGGIDGTDVGAFFGEWEAGNAIADVNADGGIDGADVSTFFEHWEAGCWNREGRRTPVT